MRKLGRRKNKKMGHGRRENGETREIKKIKDGRRV